jgi:hypothetical protein
MSANSSPRKIDPSIIAALIGVIGTIVVTLITVNANRQPAATAVPTPIVISTNTAVPSPVSTDTVQAGEPTSTPAPPTDTPVPTFTTVPPVAIGSDWGAGCISTLWQPYPANVPLIDKGDGCWKPPVLIYSADSGKLSFLYERSGSGPVETYGLFAPLPESGSVTFTVSFKDLTNADLLMGIFADADVNSQGLLMTVPTSKNKKNVITQKDNVTAYTTLQSTSPLDQGDGFSFTFTYTPNSASGVVNPSVFVTNPVSIPSAQKWLFLGYKGQPGRYRIEGNFSGLLLK